MPCLVLIVFLAFPRIALVLVVPHFELLAASVSRPIVASARVFVFTSNNVGICVDDEYAAAYSGH